MPINTTIRKQVSRAPQGRRAQIALAGLAKPEQTRSIAHQIGEMREDYQVQFARAVVTANLKSQPVTVGVEQGDQRAEALAQHCQDLWADTLAAMFDAFDYGRVAFEKVYGFNVANGLTIIEKLESLPYDRTRMLIDKQSGEYIGVALSGADGDVKIEADASWWLALDPTALEPHGKSRFMGAPHKVYKQRKEAIRLRGLFIEKFVLGWAKAHIESSYEDPQTGQLIDGHAKIQEAYAEARSGGLVTFDNARVKKLDGSEGEYKDDIEEMPMQKDTAPLDNTIDGLDADQLRAFGVPEKTAMEGEAVGSYALVTQQMRILFAVVDDILSQMVKSFQRYVVDKLVELNYAENAPRIVVSYPPMADRPDSLIVELAKSIVTQPSASPLVTQGAIDVRQVLESAGIPLTPDLEAKMQRAAQAAERQAMLESQARMQAAQQQQQAPQRFNLANDGPPSDIPDRRQLQEDVVDTLQTLLSKLVVAFGQRKPELVASLMQQIKDLQVQASAAAKILGMVSPWRPRVQANPPGHIRQQPLSLNLANDTEGFLFPWMKSAYEWLKGKRSLPADDLDGFTSLERAAVFSAPAIDDVIVLNSLRDAVAESLDKGEDFRTFRAKAETSFALTRSQLETTYRTNTKQAYLAGMEETLSQPAVQEEFPYVQYAATADTRVRDSHWELDGMVARRGTALHSLMLSALADYNCRCTMIPLSKADGETRKLSDVQDVPEYVRSIYQ